MKKDEISLKRHFSRREISNLSDYTHAGHYKHDKALINWQTWSRDTLGSYLKYLDSDLFRILMAVVGENRLLPSIKAVLKSEKRKY